MVYSLSRNRRSCDYPLKTRSTTPHGDERSPRSRGACGGLVHSHLTSESRAIISGTLQTISPSTESCRFAPSTSSQIFRPPSSSDSSSATGVRAPIGPEPSKPCVCRGNKR